MDWLYSILNDSLWYRLAEEKVRPDHNLSNGIKEEEDHQEKASLSAPVRSYADFLHGHFPSRREGGGR